MARITLELVRGRAEHNNGELESLEELSLHQQELEKIEHLDRWCRHLKILYLQNNLISRIENVSRLKELQYLNLALNNIEKIEKLEGCEFLEKLDFTVNFIGDLLSLESLHCNVHLVELYLTGNPCTEYACYREFTVATLPSLQRLDGTDITKSERILASQKLETLRPQILEQQMNYAHRRKEEKRMFEEKEGKASNSTKKPGFDGRWYTDPQAHTDERKEEEEDKEEAYTPEYRMKSHREMTERRKEQAKEPDNKLEMPKRVRKLERNGKMLNVNEGRHNFQLKDEGPHYLLEVECPRYMDTSLLDCDVHPTYIRVSIKDKILQLVLEEEISPDISSAHRSQTTGYLLLTLPKSNPTTVLPVKGSLQHLPQPHRTSAPSLREEDVRNRQVSCRGNRSTQGLVSYETSRPCPVSTTCTHQNDYVLVDNPDVPALM